MTYNSIDFKMVVYFESSKTWKFSWKYCGGKCYFIVGSIFLNHFSLGCINTSSCN